MGGGNWTRTAALRLLRGLSPRGRGKPELTLPFPPCARSIPAWAGETFDMGSGTQLTKVYPRVGGGNSATRNAVAAVHGLSPRGRGKLVERDEEGDLVGSIPAWAGETAGVKKPAKRSGVYPRVGGGNHIYSGNVDGNGGLSPRGRGKLRPRVDAPDVRGSIPAWAGETPPVAITAICTPVYPRVGGGNKSGVCDIFGMKGLSPRGRGKRTIPPPMKERQRSIPAWAGETRAQAESQE